MKKKPAWLRKWKPAPAGLVGTQPLVERVRIDERHHILVPYARMQSGLWGLKEGDIHAAYTADQRPGIRRPFQHGGQFWANWGGSERCVRCTPLVPFMRSGDYIPPQRQQFSYEGECVTWREQDYICGPEYEFRAELGPGSIADLARRMFAHGGMFASRAGSYRNLLRKWLDDSHRKLTSAERLVYEAELQADLPQTQEGMRLLLGGGPITEPRCFNPLTGRTA